MKMTQAQEEKCFQAIGYWMTEKKSQKLNWTEFGNIARKHGLDLIKLDLSRPLENQGSIVVIIHKLTDILAQAGQGDPKAKSMIHHVESYVAAHPEVAVIDPLDNVQKILDRYYSYSIVHKTYLEDANIFVPPFVELTSSDVDENIKKLKSSGVKFPCVCKSSYAHGSSDAHKMALIFNEAGVKDCKVPCVVQTFINHNAVLYKIYIVGDKYHVVERSSIKNFYTTDHETISFNSHTVSKPDSSSSLSIMDPEDQDVQPYKCDHQRFDAIVKTLRKEFGMSLLGVDIVIENGTGRYGIIDINAYPGYEGFPDFHDRLMDLVIETIENQTTNKPLSLDSRESSASSDICQPYDSSETTVKNVNMSSSGDQDDSGFDTSDSSDEKKKKKELEVWAGGKADILNNKRNQSVERI